MMAAFELIVLKACLVGIGSALLFAFVMATLPTALHRAAYAVHCAWRKGLAVLFPVAFALGMLVYGGSKNSSPTNAPPALLSAPAMARASAGPTRIEKWFRRGAWEDGELVRFDGDWRFPYGTSHLQSVELWSQGAVFPSAKAPDAIVALPFPLALAPQETEVTYFRTADNAYRFEWRNAHPNRSANVTTNVAIELRRNGDCAIVTADAETLVPYVIPYPHDGVGQDDDWVRANLSRFQRLVPSATNADEIVAVGYTNWVNAQIGHNLTNGLYRLTADFRERPLEPTKLTVGDCMVVVTNAGEYSFVLAKGEKYEFDTEPFVEEVEYRIADDIDEDAQLLRGVANDWAPPNVWSRDGGWQWLRSPYDSGGRHFPGSVLWLPTLRGSPDFSDNWAQDFPRTFEAVLSDYCLPMTPAFEWLAGGMEVEFANPHAQTTTAEFHGYESFWTAPWMSVKTEICGYTLWSDVYARDFQPDMPLAFFSMNAPSVVFLNDDDRETRWYPVTVSLYSTTVTNATVSLAPSGDTGIRFAADDRGQTLIRLSDIELEVAEPRTRASQTIYFSCAKICGSGGMSATCAFPDGKIASKDSDFRVIEPLRKLVCTEAAPNGGYYNPSRLVYGTNAWLKVGVNGDFDSFEVRWRVVSGPGRIVDIQDWAALVEPTAPAGEVVVEAAFGSDSAIQPQFVLPIVEKRRISVAACIAAVANGKSQIAQQDIERKIEVANRFFIQAGIEFYLCEPVVVLSNPQFTIVAEHNCGINSLGKQYYYGVHPDVTNLFAQVNSSAEIKAFWVDRIINGTPLAFSVGEQRSCVFANNPQASATVVPHEFGHLIGLKDIYNRRKQHKLDVLPNGSFPLEATLFSDVQHDWGLSDGRGFYESGDVHAKVIELFLMNGSDCGGCDIPSSCVEGYSAKSRHVFDTSKIAIGSANIRND